jgi:hypothetical protein
LGKLSLVTLEGCGASPMRRTPKRLMQSPDYRQSSNTQQSHRPKSGRSETGIKPS